MGNMPPRLGLIFNRVEQLCQRFSRHLIIIIKFIQRLFATFSLCFPGRFNDVQHVMVMKLIIIGVFPTANVGWESKAWWANAFLWAMIL